MNKYINKLSLFLLFLSLMVITTLKVNALSYVSDYIDLNDSVVFSTNDFALRLSYDDGAFDNLSAIVGYGHRKNDNMTYYHYIIYYYDLNKNEIGATDGYNSISILSGAPKPIESVGSRFTSYVKKENIYEDHTLSEIRYYKLFLEPSIKDVVYDYINYNKKLNSSGIDYVSDFNTIDMIAISSEQLSGNALSSNGYILNNYDININVKENNVLEITENIGALFLTDKHGIFRKIPLTNKITRLDGTISKNRAKISEINVSDKYSLYNEGGYKVIKIGDDNYTITGQKNYTINYLYDLGKDTGKGYDELYFNLVGDEWDTGINNVSFTITMPKDFDKSKLGFSSGKVGSIDSSNIIFEVNGNIITGKLKGKLNPGEALTVRLELPEGYFVGVRDNLKLMILISVIFPILMLFISYLIWRRYGKEEPIVDTVEFYPPEKFNSLEVGFLYKGKAENQDVISLLIYLANEGYIKISEVEEKFLFFPSKGFKITKLREYDGNNINEQSFLNGLFNGKRFTSLFASKNNASNNNFNEVTLKELYNNFYITMNRILSNINDKKNIYKVFERTSLNKRKIIIFILIVTYCLITMPQIYETVSFDVGTIFVTLLFPAIGFTIIFKTLFSKKGSIVSKLFSLFFSVIFGVQFWAYSVVPALMQDYKQLIIYIIGLLCIVGQLVCLKYLPKRTTYGNEIFGKLKGFKNFLETAEKDKLEALVMQDPSYFYNVLPYTYVLGVSNKWIKKFETISLQAPSWYDSSNGFDIVHFSSFINSTLSSAQKSMSSSSSSSSGGSSSGGGSSGGGSGGGGGGSW